MAKPPVLRKWVSELSMQGALDAIPTLPLLGSCVLFALSIDCSSHAAAAAPAQASQLFERVAAVSPAPEAAGQTAGSPIQVSPLLFGAGLAWNRRPRNPDTPGAAP